jgi:glycosyltransferase involved in cell wall biosynthesis
MKIAIITSRFPPKWLAGIEIVTYNLAKHLVKKGHEIHVVTSRDEELPNFDKDNGFYIHRIAWSKIRNIGMLLFWMKIFLKIRTIKPDIVHVQCLSMSISALLIRKFLDIPYIIYGHGWYFSDIHQLYRKKLFKIALQNAAAVIVLTESMKKQFVQDYEGPIFIIPNGIDLDRFRGLSRHTARKDLGINEDQKIILYTGRLHNHKGVQFLIAAMSKITHDEPHSKLLIVGEDQGEKQKIIKMIEELKLEQKIQLLNQVEPEKVLFFMSAADVFVLPSIREGFPNVLLEAMGSGLPIVCTNVDGLSEIVKDGENGFLVPPENVEQLAEKIIVLLSDTRLAKQISKNNLEKIKDYEMDNIISQLEKIYSNHL